MDSREGSVGSAASSDLYDQTETEKESVSVRQHSEAGKRKADDSSSPPQKKRKLSPPPRSPSSTLPSCARFPPEIWQNVFSYVHPHVLGRLLQVNRAFYSYLTKIPVPESRSEGRLNIQASEAIWLSSRKSHESNFPKPLIGLSELAMWKLVKGRRCQFCSKEGRPQGTGTWDQGPGKDGVRIAWAFGIRACGPCLVSRTKIESELILSSENALLPGLPFIFLTDDQHIVSLSAVQHAATLAFSARPQKRYYSTQIEELKTELELAKSLGSAAAAEWIKGLEARGKARLSDAERCERWAATHITQMNSNPILNHPVASPAPAYQGFIQHQHAPPPMDPRTWTGPSSQAAMFSPVVGGFAPPVPQYSPVNQYQYQAPHYPQAPQMPQPYYMPPSHTPTYPQVYGPPPSHPTQRPDRTIRDVAEAKANRRADIERRCETLNPPIYPNVLRHMESFKAAIQIPTVMTEQGWDILKPRLIQQRDVAEEKERQEASQKATHHQKGHERRQQDISQREMKEIVEREWEEKQRPVRDQLSTFADEIINNSRWDRGRLVTRENSPQFAASVLLHVRERFSRETNGGTTSPMGQTELTNSSGRKLILENMKWLFDHKIKHLTDRFRKELFLCNGCIENPKFYGFEGVIQHYGAKHTNSFSVGNVVVAWKEAEWPEEPPFVPDPSTAMQLLPGVPGPPGYGSMQQAGSMRGASITPHMSSHMMRPSSQASPYPIHGQGGYMSGPFPPPVVSMNAPGFGYDNSLTQNGPPSSNVNGHFYQAVPPVAVTMPGEPFTGPSREQQAHHATQANGNHASGIVPVAHSVVPAATSDSHDQADNKSTEAVIRSTASSEQVSFFAKAFIDVWSTLSNIEDLANPVRLFVTINLTSASFLKHFGREPGVHLFIEALDRDPLLNSHRSVDGLECKSCSGAEASSDRPDLHANGNSSYTILSLVLHFQQRHTDVTRLGEAGNHHPAQVDWTKEMISLPPSSSIAQLVHSKGIDDRKLDIISEAFPGLFTAPSSKQDLVRRTPSADHQKRQQTGNPAEEDIKPSLPASEKTSGPQSGGSDEEYSSPLPPLQFGPNEYDPRRPALDPTVRYARAHYRARSYRQSPPEHEDYGGSVVYVTRNAYEQEPRRRAHYYDDEGPWIVHHSGRPSVRQDPELAHSPRLVQPVPARRLPSGQSYARHNVLDMEENSTTEGREENAAPQSPTSPITVEVEADRFLKDVMDGDELEKNRHMEEERREQDSALRSMREAEQRRGYHDMEPSPREPRFYRDDIEMIPTGGTSSPPLRRSRRPEDYHTNGQLPEPRGGYHPRLGAAPIRRPRYVEPVPPSRYARYTRVARIDPSYHGQRTARPQSRYERYEATRRQIERSLSPQRRASELPESYRDQSIGPPRSSQVSPHEPTPMAEDSYSPGPPLIRYRYAAPPPIYVDENGREVQMVRAREPYIPYHSSRYVDRPPMEHDPYYEYLPYEPSHRNEPVYYDAGPGYDYAPDPRPLPRPDRDRTFEPEIRMNVEPAATPASFVEQP